MRLKLFRTLILLVAAFAYAAAPALAFDLAPAHPQSSYVVVEAGHKGTPTAAASLVIEWLRGL